MEKKVWQAYRKKGVRVMGLNVWDDGKVSKARDFAKKHGLSYLVLIDKDEKVFKEYMKPGKPRGVPTNAVVDRKGKITYLQPGYNEEAILNAVKKAL